jgi:hypothetical protein
MRQVDKDQNGEIDFDEFKTFMDLVSPSPADTPRPLQESITFVE